MKTNPDYNLRYDLAFLLYKMKRYEDSHELIVNSLELLKKMDTESKCRRCQKLAQNIIISLNIY